MKTITFLSISLVMGIFINAFSIKLPKNWIKLGDKPNCYEIGIVKREGNNSRNVATIKSIDKVIDGFGNLMQESKPDKYLGKRIRMTAYIKSENVTGWAGLWLRVDILGVQKALSFDNMSNRPIDGTTDWTKYEIVLDVPTNSSMLAYGALLYGTGQIWIDKIIFEIVDDSVKITGTSNKIESPVVNEPTNLDFRE